MDARNSAAQGRDGAEHPRIAVLVPRRNEAPTIAGVVRDFRAALPGAAIFVYDNNSEDDAAVRAAAAGAVVRHEQYPGKDTCPVAFFGAIGALGAAAAVALAVPLFVTDFEAGLVPRLPTGVLATGMMVLAFLCAFTGLVLESVARGRRETKQPAYLAFPGPLRSAASAAEPEAASGMSARPPRRAAPRR